MSSERATLLVDEHPRVLLDDDDSNSDDAGRGLAGGENESLLDFSDGDGIGLDHQRHASDVVGATGLPSLSTAVHTLRDFLKEAFGGPWSVKRAFRLGKIVLIVGVLILCAWLFSSEVEGDEHARLIAVDSAQAKVIDASGYSQSLDILGVTLNLPESDPETGTWLLVELEAIAEGASVATVVDSKNFTLEAELTKQYYRFVADEESRGVTVETWQFRITTNSDSPIAFDWKEVALPDIVKYEVIFAALILTMVYVLIVFELVHRTLAAMLGAFLALAIVSKIHSRPSLETVVSWIDFETCGLLFGMMVMVGIFSQTGFFEWSAVKAFKWAKGEVWKLVVILCIFTAVVSAFLDNVTTILLITPVTIRLANVMGTTPQQILIALVMFSNIGGTATPVGDPPNIIILNDKRVQKHAPEINFGTFTLHMAPGVILASITSYFVIRRLSQHIVKKTNPYENDKREIAVWKRTLGQMRTDTEDEQRVHTQLQEYVVSLEDELKQKMDSTAGRGSVINIAELEEKYPIRDRPLLVNSSIVLTFVILLFFLHSAIHLELSLAWIAIIGAIAHLTISGIRDIEEVLEKVEFGTLMFFAGLFVLMEALDELGLIDFVGEQTVSLISAVPAGQGRLAAAVVIIIWVSAIVSAFIDNIPYTAAMVPVVVMLGTDPELDIPLSPLIYSLAFGTCLGGNGTLIGASANVVAAGISEAQGYPISFNSFFRTGFPTMVTSVATITVYMLVFHVLIPWR